MENLAQANSPALQPSPPVINVWLIARLLLVSTLIAFAGGYLYRTISQVEPSNTQENREIFIPLIPGKAYYDDTIMAVTQDTPRRVLVATVSRREGDQGATAATRVSFFDGQDWTRKTVSEQVRDLEIYPNSLLTEWKIDIDPSRVLRQSVRGALTIGNNVVGFDTGELFNNIGMRSLPGYTKFMSTQNGYLNINGKRVEAKILYTRIYSNNSAEMQFYETPFGLTTNWMAFWDSEGNFYHLDRTEVDQATDKYQTHQIGVKVAKDGGVYKTFTVGVEQSEENPPKSYRIRLGEPINQTIQMTIGKSVNKAPSDSYTWFMSEGQGAVDELNQGYGVVEYIHN